MLTKLTVSKEAKQPKPIS